MCVTTFFRAGVSALMLSMKESFNMKRTMATIMAAAMVMSAFAGCGGKQKETPASSANASAPAAAGSEASDATAASGDVIKLKLGMVDPENSNYYKGAQAIAEEVKKATDGKVEITVYAGGQLGNERDMYEGAQMGTIDICTTASAVLTSFVPEMAVLDQPFLFANADEAHKVIDGKLGQLIAEKTAAQGVHMVGWMESGFRNVFSVKPIEKIEDFKGVKIRTMENDIHMAAFNALGAIATPMAAGDQFTALQQHTIDAAENATANVLANNFYEITKNITRSQHLFVFIGVGVSDKAWNQIPDDLKDKFTEGVKAGCDKQRQYLVEANEAAEKELIEKGVAFHEVDTATLQTAVQPAMEQFKDRMPQEWLDAIAADKAA